MILLVGHLIGLLLTVAVAPAATACSCGTLTDDEAFEAADVVFSGDVISDGRVPPVFNSEELVEIRLRTIEVFKGQALSQQAVYTSASGASCGVELPVGRWMVFARTSDQDELLASLCDGTRIASNVPEFNASGGPPAPGVSPVRMGRTDEPSRSNAATVIFVGAVLLVVSATVGVAAVSSRRRRGAGRATV